MSSVVERTIRETLAEIEADLVLARKAKDRASVRELEAARKRLSKALDEHVEFIEQQRAKMHEAEVLNEKGAK